MTPEQIILSRLVPELAGRTGVFLGSGIPSQAGSRLRPDQLVPAHSQRAEVVVLEAREVSSCGDLVGDIPEGLEAPEWIVAARHLRPDGTPRIVSVCRSPVSRSGCVRRIITELGVLTVGSEGLVLEEVAPGVSSDDVRKHTDSSLHVADALAVMEL